MPNTPKKTRPPNVKLSTDGTKWFYDPDRRFRHRRKKYTTIHAFYAGKKRRVLCPIATPCRLFINVSLRLLGVDLKNSLLNGENRHTKCSVMVPEDDHSDKS
jgi:hypothetical protein